MTVLPNGTVLVTGDQDNTAPLSSVEVYNPTLDTWTTVTSMSVARSFHTATLLPDGTVVVGGGFGTVLNPSAEIYTPTSLIASTWAASPGTAPTARFHHSALLLGDGTVLAVGGVSGGVSLVTSEIYTLVSGFAATGSMGTARRAFPLARLSDGSVLGGFKGSSQHVLTGVRVAVR